MTNEQIEKKADMYAERHAFRVPYDGSNNFYDDKDFEWSKEGFIAGAQSRQAEIDELNNKIDNLNKSINDLNDEYDKLCKSSSKAIGAIMIYKDNEKYLIEILQELMAQIENLPPWHIVSLEGLCSKVNKLLKKYEQ